MTLPAFSQVKGLFWQHPQRDSNPCYRRERAGSWAARRWGPETRISIRESGSRTVFVGPGSLR